MISGAESEISNGAIGSQGSLEQMNASIQAMKNEESLIERTTRNENDYFIGPNGNVLPAKYKNGLVLTEEIP